MTAFTGFYDGLNSDAIIVYLVSLIKWTPFMWEQDRYGMLIPLLALPVQDAFANMIVQNILHITASFAVFMLTARYLFQSSRWLLIGAISLTLFLAFDGAMDLKNFLTPWQIYTPALAIGLLSLISAKRAPWLAAGLAIIAQWCNFSMGVLLVLLSVFKNGFENETTTKIQKRQSLFKELGALGIGLVAGEILRRQFPSEESGGYTLGEPLSWATGWYKMIAEMVSSPLSNIAVFQVPATIAAVVAALVLVRRIYLRPNIARGALAGLAASFVYIVLIGATSFAASHGYPHRYLIPSLMIIIVSFTGFAAVAIPGRVLQIKSGYQLFAMAALILVIVISRFGMPSSQTVHDSLNKSFGAMTKEAIDLKCTHMAGDYYRVWPVVFLSRMDYQKPMWGIAGRSRDIRNLWDFTIQPINDPRICVWKDNFNNGVGVLQYFKFTKLRKVADSATMMVIIPDNEN